MTNNERKTVIYQLEADDLEQIIFRAVADAMEQYRTSSNTQVESSSDSKMLTRAEAAKYLHVTQQTLFNWERLDYLIPVRAGRRVLYPVELLRQFANTANK